MMRILIFLFPVLCFAATVPADISGVQQGPVMVSATSDTLTVRWPDEASRTWTAEFSLDTQKPLITKIDLEGSDVVRNGSPHYWAVTG
jgi:hypothetical protein